MTRAEALQSFLSSFGWNAYDESSVPDNALKTIKKYITYSGVYSGFEDQVALPISLWSRSTSWKEVQEKSEYINDYVSLFGVIVDYDNGKIWIKRGRPFAQRVNDEDDTVRRILINLEIEYFTNK